MQPLSVSNRERRSTYVLCEQATKMAARHAKSVGQVFNIPIIESAVRDQPQPSTYGCGSPAPGRGTRSTFGPASQAGSEPRLAGGSGTRVERNIAALRSDSRAYWTTIDTRCLDADEKLPVKTRVSR